MSYLESIAAIEAAWQEWMNTGKPEALEALWAAKDYHLRYFGVAVRRSEGVWS